MQVHPGQEYLATIAPSLLVNRLVNQLQISWTHATFQVLRGIEGVLLG